MSIYSETKLVGTLSDTEKATMFGLLGMEFLGVNRADFLRDLGEKEAAMLLRQDGPHGEIVGFSTLMTLDLLVGEQRIRAIFSGDTTVLPQYRRSTGIGVEMVGYFLSTMRRFPDDDIYWVLISKGWRTYRILPFFFRRFAPRCDAPTSHDEKAIMDAFGAKKYPYDYRPDLGLIMFNRETQRLVPGSIDAVPPQLPDPHVSFFTKKNPTYLAGTELVCVAKVAPENFTDAANRVIATRMQRSSS